jgi:hypothetical protein
MVLWLLVREARTLSTHPGGRQSTNRVLPEEPAMSNLLSRRSFTAVASGLVLGSAAGSVSAGDEPKAPAGPTEAPFERDSPRGVKPSWKKHRSTGSGRTSSSRPFDLAMVKTAGEGPAWQPPWTGRRRRESGLGASHGSARPCRVP